MNRHIRSTAVTVAVLALALVGAAACGTGSGARSAQNAAAIYAKYGSMTPAQRDPALLKLAKQEGTLQFYSAWTYAQAMATAFEKKYGLQVSTYSGDNETVLQKVQQEAQAHRSRADLVEMGYLEETTLDRAKMFYQGWKPGLAETKTISPGWFPTRYLAFVVAWNTKAINGGDVPASFQDLTKPKYKGKITIEQGDFDWYAALDAYYTSHGMSENQFQTMFKGIVANSTVTKGHTAMAQNLATGEDAILADGYSQSVDDLTAKNAPVAWKLPDGKPAVSPIPVYPSGVGLMNDAASPAAAMLLADFMLGPDGQRIYSSHEAIPADQALDPFLTKYQTITPPTDKLLASQQYQNTYNDLLSSVK
jgi:iron(III) transport system substrate-binding protein